MQKKEQHFLLPLILLAIAFVVLLLTIYPYYRLNNPTKFLPKPTPTPTPVAIAWQTYKNDQKGFELKYPNDWVISMTDAGIIIRKPDSYYINIAIYEEDPTYGLECLRQIADEKIIVGGYSARLTSYEPETDPDTRVLCGPLGDIKERNDIISLKKSDHEFYKIEYVYNSDTQQKKLYDQILSTFKFLPDTTTWKTYKNTQYGFEFQYPAYFYPDIFIHITSLTYDEVIKQYNSSRFPKPTCTPKKPNCSFYEKVISESLTSIGDQTVYRFKRTGGESDVNFFYFSHQNKSFLIDIYFDDAIADQILSTFKFTK
jgi:hypothetical protein